MKLPVIIYQMDVAFGDPQKNFNKFKSMIKQESPQHDTLVVLPELFISGYHPDTVFELGGNEHYPLIDEIRKVSQEYGIRVYGSVPLRLDGKPANTAILIDKGEITSKYSKSHLFGPMGEKDLFDAGRSVVTAELDSAVTVGMSICYDLRFPELYRKQGSEGANLFLICAEWPIERISHWTALLRARAIENQVTLVACNRVGEDPDYHYGGMSVAFNSYGEEIIRASGDEEEILKFELETTDLTSFREKFDTEVDKWI